MLVAGGAESSGKHDYGTDKLSSLDSVSSLALSKFNCCLCRGERGKQSVGTTPHICIVYNSVSHFLVQMKLETLFVKL